MKPRTDPSKLDLYMQRAAQAYGFALTVTNPVDFKYGEQLVEGWRLWTLTPAGQYVDGAHSRVEWFDRRGTEPNELFRSEFGRNSVKFKFRNFR